MYYARAYTYLIQMVVTVLDTLSERTTTAQKRATTWLTERDPS